MENVRNENATRTLSKKKINEFVEHGMPACNKFGTAVGGQYVQCYKLDGCDEVLVEYGSASTPAMYALFPSAFWDQLDAVWPAEALGVGYEYYEEKQDECIAILRADCLYDIDMRHWYGATYRPRRGWCSVNAHTGRVRSGHSPFAR